MSAITKAVQPEKLHKHVARGDIEMNENKDYAATYHFGNTVVHVVAPPPMTPEEKQKKVDEFYKAAWQVVKSLNEKNMAN